MRLGIIGAGHLAQAVATRAAAAGHDAIISNRQGPESLRSIVDRLGTRVTAGTPYQAARADTVVLAVPGDQIAFALADLEAWNGRTLVDATNHIQSDPLLPGLLSTSEVVADLAQGAHVIKAFNTIPANVLAADPSPYPGLRRVLFVSGDDVPSKEAFRSLLENIGYSTIDLGGLAEGSRLQQLPGGALGAANLLRVSPEIPPSPKP